MMERKSFGHGGCPSGRLRDRPAGAFMLSPNIKPAVSMVMSFVLSLPLANFIERGCPSTCAGARMPATSVARQAREASTPRRCRRQFGTMLISGFQPFASGGPYAFFAPILLCFF